ncbi:MAG: 30S ribosome-binding factor RbfA [Magnetococcales bacterium]|nr:30S ribosome-binding factor RbfA [Magnetococcales bacterium]
MSVRVDRVRGQIRKELADIFQRGEVHDPRVALSMISITDVTLSRDLHYAIIHFTVMGQEIAEVHAGLKRAAGFLRAKVGRTLGLRLAPELRFEPDLSFKRADQIEQLLKTIHIPPTDGAEMHPEPGA